MRGAVCFKTLPLRPRIGLNGTPKALLAPCFVEHDGNGVGEVQASLTIDHFQTQQVSVIKLVSDVLRQAACFLAKEQPVASHETAFMDIRTAFGAQGEQARSIRVLGV